MPAVQHKRAPAYDDARFDAEGFCLAHADVRLGKRSDGKYTIVRKTCFKCGTAALGRRTTSRGGRRKTTSCRVVPSDVLAAPIGADCHPHPKKTTRCKPAKAEHRHSQDLAADTKPSQPPGPQPPGRKGGVVRGVRRQTLSPLPSSPLASQNRGSPVPEIVNVKVSAVDKTKESRHPLPPSKPRAKCVPSEKPGPSNNKRSQAPDHKGGSRRIRRHSTSLLSSHSISLLSKSSPTSQNKQASMSEMARKKVTNGKIKELMHLMPSSGTGTKECPSKGEGPFDRNGFCRAHPQVCLAKKRPEGGGWDIVSGVCPQCCVSAVMACQQHQPSAESPNNTDELIGKILKMRSNDSYMDSTKR